MTTMHAMQCRASSACLASNNNGSSEVLKRVETSSRVEYRQAGKVDFEVRGLSSSLRRNFSFRIESSTSSNIPSSEAFHVYTRIEPRSAVHQDGRGPTGVAGAQQQTAGGNCLAGRIVAFTTPLQYATRFEKLLSDQGAEPLWCPTIVTEQSEQTRQELETLVRRLYSSESEFHGVAFTSRAGIKAFANALNGRQLPFGTGSHPPDPKGEEEDSPFIVAALGKDAELLVELNMIADSPRVALVVPGTSTPHVLVEALGEGRGRKLLCPVPLVEGLEEPPVVPQFLKDLSRQGWDPVRVNSYVTRWLGGDCAKALLVNDAPVGEATFVPIDALVFTSSAEIEGLLKSLASLGHDGVQALERGTRKFLVASHGPVTALGAERLGVEVDVVGKKFQSFSGVIEALEAELSGIAHAGHNSD